MSSKQQTNGLTDLNDQDSKLNAEDTNLENNAPSLDSGEELNEANAAAAATEQTQVSGRSVFSIETTAAGVVVRTAFMTDDNRLLDMPMVFPDAMYAFNVIDDLKGQVAEHFGRAARVGAQVIAQQAQEANKKTDTDTQ